jgi:hypothetical protein
MNPTRTSARSAPAALALAAAGLLCMPRTAPAQAEPDTAMSFFITSAGLGHGANLGGLAGADAHCQELADAVGAGKRTWHAYLSTQPAAGKPAVNARDRIGTGPWFNAKGVRVAGSIGDLHGPNNKLGKENSLTEKGAAVNGRGDNPNQHDMLTGSNADGTAFPAGADKTCSNWTSESAGSAMLGHHDRHGVAGNIDSTSWNQAHLSSGCSQQNLIGTGGNGYFYCFAADAATGLREPRGDVPGGRLSGFAWMGVAAGGDATLLVLDLGGRRRADAAVYALDGRKMADLRPENRGAGRIELRWDGRDRIGHPVPRGFYVIGVTVR